MAYPAVVTPESLGSLSMHRWNRLATREHGATLSPETRAKQDASAVEARKLYHEELAKRRLSL